mmetsp:Transcript_118822/g.236721  ORF Transcript_118822/g.236721 Transcript_118822/m.236721 type:complete len:249 (+) Transcript_118822:180-926(+)
MKTSTDTQSADEEVEELRATQGRPPTQQSPHSDDDLEATLLLLLPLLLLHVEDAGISVPEKHWRLQRGRIALQRHLPFRAVVFVELHVADVQAEISARCVPDVQYHPVVPVHIAGRSLLPDREEAAREAWLRGEHPCRAAPIVPVTVLHLDNAALPGAILCAYLNVVINFGGVHVPMCRGAPLSVLRVQVGVTLRELGLYFAPVLMEPGFFVVIVLDHIDLRRPLHVANRVDHGFKPESPPRGIRARS